MAQTWGTVAPQLFSVWVEKLSLMRREHVSRVVPLVFPQLFALSRCFTVS
jgi:hypothetical protein